MISYSVRKLMGVIDQFSHKPVTYVMACAYAAMESEKDVIAVELWDGGTNVGVKALFYKGHRIWHWND